MPRTYTSLTLEDAKQMLSAAEAKAASLGIPYCVAVVDAGGHLVAFLRQDGALIGSVDLAIDKAATARIFDKTTSDLATLAQSGKPLFGIQESNAGKVVIFGGGIPVVLDQAIVGAGGACAGTVEQDIAVAEAAIAALHHVAPSSAEPPRRKALEATMQIRSALLNGPLGFGAAPLGNMFRRIPDEEAAATVEAAWRQGTRYFDTAPLYGAGLSEIRLGRALAQHKRDDYLLSTKVGRLILDEVETGARNFGEKQGLFEFGSPNRVVYDYSSDGALRSIDGSLKRLRVDRLDFVWVHDVAQDFHGDGWLAQFETARTGAFRALTKLREEGVIKG